MHQAVSLLGIKVLLTCLGEMRLWGKMIWVGPQWVRECPWSMFHKGGTFCMLVKGFCLFGFCFVYFFVFFLVFFFETGFHV